MKRRTLDKVENYNMGVGHFHTRETPIIHWGPVPGTSGMARTLCGCENGGYRPAPSDAVVDCPDCLAIVRYFRGDP